MSIHLYLAEKGVVLVILSQLLLHHHHIKRGWRHLNSGCLLDLEHVAVYRLVGHIDGRHLLDFLRSAPGPCQLLIILLNVAIANVRKIQDSWCMRSLDLAGRIVADGALVCCGNVILGLGAIFLNFLLNLLGISSLHIKFTFY